MDVDLQKTRPIKQQLWALQGIYLAQTFLVVLERVLAYSWLLEDTGSRSLPWVFLLQAVPHLILTFALIGLVDRMGRATLFALASLGFAVWVVLIDVLQATGVSGLSILFLLAGESAISLFGVHFWLLTNELLSPEQSRQHFPSLTLAGALGAIAAGLFAQRVPAGAASASLPVLLLPLAICCILSLWLLRRFPHRVGPKVHEHADWRSELEGGLAEARNSPLLLALAGLTAVITVSGVLIDYASTLAAETLGSAMALPAFFGAVNVVINVLQILVVLALGSRIFTTFGLFRTLSSYPLGALFLAGTAIFSLSLWPAVALKVFDRLENYIVLNPGTGLAQSAFDKRLRGRASLLCGGLVKPLSISATGLLLLSVEAPSRVFLVLSGVLLVFLVLLRSAATVYRRTLVGNLRARDRRLVTNSIEALAERENSPCVSQIIEFYRSTQDPLYRENVLAAAGRLRDERFVPILLTALQEAGISQQCAAARSLASFPSPVVQEALVNALKQADSPRVKASILRALAIPFEASVHYPALLEGLRDPDPRVCANAIEAIGLTGDPHLARLLHPFLRSPVPRVRANAVIALSRFPSERPSALSALNGFLESRDRALWLSALHAAGEVADESLIGLLRLSASMPDPDIQRNALIALAKYDDLSTVPLLARLLLEPEGGGVSVAYAMERFGPHVHEDLVAALTRLEPTPRAQVLATLKGCGINYPELLEQLEPPYEMARSTAKALTPGNPSANDQSHVSALAARPPRQGPGVSSPAAKESEGTPLP